jgi:hypothetical protein
LKILLQKFSASELKKLKESRNPLNEINQKAKPSKTNGFDVGWKVIKENSEIGKFLPLAVSLLLYKDWVKERTKKYLENHKFPQFLRMEDKLSLNYDDFLLTQPYSYRVLARLMSSNGKSTLFQTDKFWEEILTEKEEFLNKDNLKERLIEAKVDGLPLISLIIDESVNQSLKGMAGSSYHERIKEIFSELLNLKLVSEKKADSKNKGIEYDFVYSHQEKKIGISAKRTLKERWKQNWDDTRNLEVDIMFLITLGIDLNKDKAQTILQKQGWYIIVASEMYESQDYFQNNPKVFASNQVKGDFLDKVFELEEKKLK